MISPDEVRALARRFAPQRAKRTNPDVNRGRWGKTLRREPARLRPAPPNALPCGLPAALSHYKKAMKLAQRAYTHSVDLPPALSPTEDFRKARAWGRKHPSPFRRRTRKERGMTSTKGTK